MSLQSKLGVWLVSFALLQVCLACGKREFKGSVKTGKYASTETSDVQRSPEPSPEPEEIVLKEVPVESGESVLPEAPIPLPKVPDDTTLFFSKTDGVIAQKQGVTSGALNIEIEDILDSSENETAQVRPELAIQFVIDRSSSMGPELDTVKRGVRKFSDNLVAAGFQATFGGIAFQDPIDSQFEPSSIDSFKNFVDGISLGSPNGNNDFPEGSLAGLSSAVNALSSSVNDPEVVPVIVLFTDALGHNGGSGSDTTNRNCSGQPFLNLMNSEFGRRIIFFHSTSSSLQPANNSPASCFFQRPTDQFSQIQAAVNAQTPGKYRGEALPFPFNDQVLTDSLPKLLVDKIVPRNISCSVEGATLSDGSGPIRAWTKAEMDVGPEGNLFLPEALKSGESPLKADEIFDLLIDRCCERNADQSCKTARQQKVTFKIEVQD